MLKKLLFLSWRDIKAPKMGGAEVFTHEMLKLVDKSKYAIVHFSPRFKGASSDEVIDGVRYLRKGNILTVILWAMLHYFMNRKEYDYVIDQCNVHRFFTPLWISRKKRIFFIHQLARELWLRNWKKPFSLIGYYSEDFMTKIYKNNITLTVSNSTRNDLLALGFKEEYVKILPEGINFEPWNPGEFFKKDIEYTFTYVGRYARYKGIDSAVRAFGEFKMRYPKSKLWLVGKENEVFKEEVLLPICKLYNLKPNEDVVFHGFVSEEMKLELMSRSHAIIYPSDREGWGLTVTEAAVVGTPSIVYNSAGLIDAVNQGEAGFLSKSNSPEGLLEQMITSVENANLYEAVRTQAYNYSKQFQWTVTAEVFEVEMQSVEEVLS